MASTINTPYDPSAPSSLVASPFTAPSGGDFLNYIGGAWVAAESGQKIPKLNPFDGTLLGNVVCSDAMDVIKSLVHAKKSQAAYEKTTLLERASFLRRISDALLEKVEEYSFQEALHQGLSQDFVKEKSVTVAAHFFRTAAQECENFEARAGQALPTGIVSIITSWCLSLRLISERLAPALAAGNAVLIKVSELSPVTAVILAEVLEKAQCPPGLVQIFQGTGLQVGSLLSAHPSIRAVSFVGKNIHADHVIKAASHQYKKIQVCMGAKNSAFILQETNYENLMPQILESFLVGQGQLCWNTHRLFIPESISKNLLECLQSYLSRLVPSQGPQDQSTTALLPLIDEAAVHRTLKKTEEAQVEHAKILFGSQSFSSAGNFVKPTFTLDLTNCSVLQQDEINAPLFIVTAVKYQHEMVKWSNTGYYGHSAVVWGPEMKVDKAAAPLQCSQIWTNGWLTNDNFIPGHKQSSYGNMDMRSFGSFFSDVKNVSPPL